MDRTYKLDILFKVLEFLIKASLTLCFCKGTGVVYSGKLFDLGELVTTDDDTNHMYRAHFHRVHSNLSRTFRLRVFNALWRSRTQVPYYLPDNYIQRGML